MTEARDEGAPWVARGDFTRCFDEIPRARLLDRLAKVVPDAEFVDLVRRLMHRPVEGGPQHGEKGLHQGSALSPVLTNLYLDQFDRTMLDGGWQVIRYGDDYAIPVADRVAGDAAVGAAQRAAAALGLELSPQKCSVRSFDEGVPFLGQVVTSGTGLRTERRSHPHATTVFVAEKPNGLLRSRGSRLRLERGGELVFSVAFPRVRQVVVFGRVGMTTPFLQQVLVRGIDVVLLSDHGKYIGRLQGATATNPFVRQRQYEAERTRARRMDLAQRIVRGKIVNLRVGLLRARRRVEQLSFTRRIDRMGELLESVPGARNLASLMGVEGAATRDYFAGLTQLIAAEWGFTHRRRRPPPDPSTPCSASATRCCSKRRSPR
ncbi:MAG: CRISPR-associated endonuclease Cas1 [Egibacteraceae bacterium]